MEHVIIMVLLKKGVFVESKHYGGSENVCKLKEIDANVSESMSVEFQPPVLSVYVTGNTSVFFNI